MGAPIKRPRVSVDNVTFLNPKAEIYHAALQAAQNDLYMIFCEDLWQEPRLATKEASEAFEARFKGKSAYMIVPIAVEAAVQLGDDVLVAEEIAEINFK